MSPSQVINLTEFQPRQWRDSDRSEWNQFIVFAGLVTQLESKWMTQLITTLIRTNIYLNMYCNILLVYVKPPNFTDLKELSIYDKSDFLTINGYTSQINLYHAHKCLHILITISKMKMHILCYSNPLKLYIPATLIEFT